MTEPTPELVTVTETVYGVGGYDPNLPNDNVVEVIVHEVPAPAPVDELAELRAQLAELQARLDSLS